MTQRLNRFGFLAVCASLFMLTACGDTSDDDGNILANHLLPESEEIVVNNRGEETVTVNATVTRSEEVSRSDAREIASIMIQQAYLPDQAYEGDIDDLRDFNPRVEVVELPEFENDNLYRIQRSFSARGYICRPDANQFNQYLNVVCVRADAEQNEQEEQQQ